MIVTFGVFGPLAITTFGGAEGYFFGLAILAFGAFEFIVPKYYYDRLSLRQDGEEGSRLLNLRRLGSSKYPQPPKDHGST